jgi:hypothetical protein
MSGQKIAGGMSYRTLEGIDYIYMEHLFEEGNPSEIFDKKKEYYLASANKTIARLILARTRISEVKLKENVVNNLNLKISKGIEWIRKLKKNIQNSEDEKEFQKAISYKKWHALKLIPQAAEGCALSCFLEEKLNKRASNHINISERTKNGIKINLKSKNLINKSKDADLHNKKARRLLIIILDSNKDTNFKLAEEQLSKAYEELDIAFKSFKLL